MSKRKPATASKRPQSTRKSATAPKRVAARSHRNKQAFVRSPSLVVRGSTESPVEVQHDSTQESAIVEKRPAPLQPILQGGFGQNAMGNSPKKGFDFPLPLANMQAYQAKLFEVTQGNMQFVFEFIQRLAAIRSPFEYWVVIAEFTGRRITMMGNH